ncbi:anti-sigma regulatory factor (Ser/Thr protein kinase) [Pseudonocardia hierapolitana]|uniref:Anti-sigma regulatory factor (Ser/Thr protein kinase) n=1 Tax=Pseudonocardia hierapolitana TaxID=1128676 RepID=A0A561SLP3_9PSEU|nr:ATP-binding protein [Pseudonocardia hierapolitana]TWF75779.1 anti-sigma regulatory factor (Ser/Thr protein kinase) [Pseudonocardia hierapolitana]
MESSPHPQAAGPPDDVISMVLMADPVSLSVVRERFRRWLGALCWPPREVDDVVMAVNEAVTSAVEHTHPSAVGAEVRVAARQYAERSGERRVLVAVAGGEHWTPEPEGFEGPGLVMIHTCMDAVEVTREVDGVTMLLTSAKVPPLGR